MQITFHGAAQTVTGSKHLITTASGKKILLDCGLFQGLGSEGNDLNHHFGFAPSEITYLFLSHAHIDHSGLIPALVKQGFTGAIYCSDATLDLCRIMLTDSAHIQENDVVYLNKKRRKKGLTAIKALYTIEDVELAMKQFVALPIQEYVSIDDEIELMLTDAGHILGSTALSMRFQESGKSVQVYYSGDTGRYTDIILKSPAAFPQADYILTESTYGDRLHEGVADAENRLLNIVVETCLKRRGKLIIPAFSLGRTQEIVYALDRLHTRGLMPHIPVYIDSPLAVNATEIMRKHPEYFNPEILEYMKKDKDPFGYDDVTYIQELEESKALNESREPQIIISASGMLDAGRIRHHIKNNIEDSRNTILLVGYVSPDSLGGKLLRGEKEVSIFGKEYQVLAQVETMEAYSAHADYQELLRNLSCQKPELVKTVFIVHGEPEAQLAFKSRLMESGFKDIRIPMQGESFELS